MTIFHILLAILFVNILQLPQIQQLMSWGWLQVRWIARRVKRASKKRGRWIFYRMIGRYEK